MQLLAKNWYVITGGPSSGKTTVLNELSKLGYLVIPETARALIDQEIKKGETIKEIRKDEIEFQKKVLQLKIEIEEAAPKDKIVFFDRAIPDSIAYWQVHGENPQEIIKLCQKIGKRYRKVFLLAQLPLEKDGVRIEDNKVAEDLNQLLRKSYENLGYKVINVPAISVKDRVQKILVEITRDRGLFEF